VDVVSVGVEIIVSVGAEIIVSVGAEVGFRSDSGGAVGAGVVSEEQAV